MDPNVEAADNKLEQAEQIETTAAEVRSEGTGDAATELETTAANLRSEAEAEKAEAESLAADEKAGVDEKYGTS